IGLGLGLGRGAEPQAPNYRVTYHLRAVERAGGVVGVLATAVVSGPPETDLRLSLQTGRTELEGLLGTLPEPDTVNLAGLFAAGETRASEETTIVDSTVVFEARAVVPPRRVTVRMSLVRGDTASSPRVVDLVPETTGRRVRFTLGGETFDFDVTLERPDPPRTGRDSALAVGVDMVCLRLVVPGAAEPARLRCGRPDNIARRVALTGGDTLVATFAWPAV